jgi:hypothetical protein
MTDYPRHRLAQATVTLERQHDFYFATWASISHGTWTASGDTPEEALQALTVKVIDGFAMLATLSNE